jgi:hypothetical protein
MSTKYTGGFITKSPVAPTTTAASGIWTLDQQQQAQKAGTWPSPPIFIEDLFSTYVYTGTDTTATGVLSINNGIDLAGKGGLVWIKARGGATSNALFDTTRGTNKLLASNSTAAQSDESPYTLGAFNSNGFSLGSATLGSYALVNALGEPYVSWTFREQPKFFDVVTYSGNGSAGGQTINHSLGSAPGCIIVKQTSSTQPWRVYHQSLGVSAYLALNSSAASATDANNPWQTPTSTTFGVGDGTYWTSLNASGSTYIAYLFAHDAGGFPVSGGGSTNGISCGSFTSDGSGNATVTLGYEPQWILYKPSSSVGNWEIADIMRGWNNTNIAPLYPDSSAAEGGYTANTPNAPTATGFTFKGLLNTSSTYIYIAIRRGPMKPPTVGTSVFSPQVQTPTGGANNSMASNSGFPIDWLPTRQKDTVIDWYQTSRLTNNYMQPNTDAAEATYTYGFDRMSGVGGGSFGWNTNSTVSYAFRRAAGFFDVVCYTGTLANLTVTHNLGVAPEMMIVKCRSSSTPGGIAANWAVYAAPQGNSKFALLNTTDLFGTSAVLWQATTPTASNFFVGAANYVNGSAEKYVAYLFASVAGVSKVGTYTGTGALLTVDCGFTSGVRFILIKRADTSGDWWTYDSARGITSGNDPYLFINSTAAEVTGTNYVDTDTTGFKVTAAAPAGLNASGGTYIFLAIA